MWQRLESLRALPSAERAVTWRAHGWVLGLWLALKLLPYRVISAHIGALPRRPGADLLLGTCVVRRSMGRAQRTFPFIGCLPQALAAEALLRELGHEAVRHLGVDPQSDPRAGTALRAHAWVTSHGDVIVGGDDAPTRYRPLSASPGAPQPGPTR